MHDVLEFKQKRKTTISLIYHKQVPTWMLEYTVPHLGINSITSIVVAVLVQTTLDVCAGPITCHSDLDHSWL